MKWEYLEDVAELLTQTFKEHNDIWKSADLNENELREFFRKEIEVHLRSQEKIRVEFNNPQIILNLVLLHLLRSLSSMNGLLAWPCTFKSMNTVRLPNASNSLRLNFSENWRRRARG